MKKKKKKGFSAFFSTIDINNPITWLPKALFIVCAFAFAFLAILAIWPKVSYICTILLIAFFIALALEPVVDWLEKHKINRKIAALICVSGVIIIFVVVVVLFGGLFITQGVELIHNAPSVYADGKVWLNDTFHLSLPAGSALISTAIDKWGAATASKALDIGASVVTGSLSVMGIILVTYYLCVDGDHVRRIIAGMLEPSKQEGMIESISIAQSKIASFLASRLILALCSTIVTSTYLGIMHIPYWFALAVFMGLISQFIPVVGTFIGGALPVIVTLTSPGHGIVEALIVLALLTIYQQLENAFLVPKISGDALDINPALAFVAVLAFGSIWGALGTFLALPTVATITAIIKNIVQPYAVDESLFE
ncbi:MAG: AI-2E family transporter [Candidatus Ancillula sp.]|jgi:predicted PurR-regulated permease PerM|nr:AI-2E family transporter [Candidatus Ancillula sp.]